MRIVAGLYGGRRLFVPKDQAIRPTTDKIRGAVFNMLESRGAVDGANVLDVFCGSGALGLEAMSRGATMCSFFDKSRDSLDLARKNAEMLGVKAEYILKDFTKAGVRPSHLPAFDLVFLDPPYHLNLVEQGLKVLIEGDWLAVGAWIVCETEKRCQENYVQGENCSLSLESEKKYGETRIVILRFAA